MGSKTTACPSGRLAGLSIPVLNETRIQEMYAFAQRKQETTPGPGAYQVTHSSSVVKHCHRRPNIRHLDGPFPLQPGEVSLRCRQNSQLILLQDSGVSPVAYLGLTGKDACLTRAPTPKIGTASRTGTAPVSLDKLCLSLSRCMASGLNWSIPVPVGQLQHHMASTSSPHGQHSTTCSRPTAGTGSCNVSTSQHGVCTAASGRPWNAASTRQQVLQLDNATCKADHRPCAGCSCSSNGSSQQVPQSSPAACLDASARPEMPWRLARQLEEWESLEQALKQADQQPCIPQRQQSVRASSIAVLDKQQVLQHLSAARAVEAVAQLAARRKKWEQLSRGMNPPEGA